MISKTSYITDIDILIIEREGHLFFIIPSKNLLKNEKLHEEVREHVQKIFEAFSFPSFPCLIARRLSQNYDSYKLQEIEDDSQFQENYYFHEVYQFIPPKGWYVYDRITYRINHLIKKEDYEEYEQKYLL